MPTVTGSFGNSGGTFVKKVTFVPVTFPKVDATSTFLVSDKIIYGYTDGSGELAISLYPGSYEVHLDDADTFKLITVGSSAADLEDIVVATVDESDATPSGSYFGSLASAKAATSLVDGGSYFISDATILSDWFRYDADSATAVDDIDVHDLDSLSGRLLRNT